MSDQTVLRIARVIEVNGFRTIGEMEASVLDLYRTYRSRRYAIGQVGSVVRIDTGDTHVFGIITSLRMLETPEVGKRGITRPESANTKWIEIELFGQGRKTGIEEAEFDFERGVSSYPLPGQPIYLATVEELRKVYAKPDKPTIKVGSVSQVKGLPVHLITDELIGKHTAVLGTTGSGKSCAVALLLHGILNEYPHAHIVLFDPHDEYPSAFPEKAELLDPTKLEIPHWMLNFEESVELFVGKTEYAATSQTNILKEALLKARRQFPNPSLSADKITVDTPVPYRLGDLQANIEAAKQGLTPSKAESHDKILTKLEILRNDKRFEFMFLRDNAVTDSLVSLMSRHLRIPDLGKPLSIIDLSGVPSEVVDVVVSVLCRAIFDFALWNPDRQKMPLLLVCEEAHRYAPRKDEAAFEPTKQALARIAKEGRKYGVGLFLVSQRPSELSETILSQCNTTIALRMSNEADQHFVSRALPDSVRSLVDALPALRTREGLVVGEGCSVPVRILFDEIPLNLRPRSSNIPFAESWKNNDPTEAQVTEAVRRWRAQDRSQKTSP
jgi:uncharacterized protein